jgi:hypothetical protein
VSRLGLAVVGDARVVRAAYEVGINFFVLTTDMHWPVYEATRRGLTDLFRDIPTARDDVVVMGMCYVTEPRFCHAPFEELVAAVPGLTCIDVSCIAAVRDRDFLLRWDEHRKHRTATRIASRALAGSFDDNLAARVAIASQLVDLAVLGVRPSNYYLRDAVLRSLSADTPVPVYSMGVGIDLLPESRLKELGIGADKWRPTFQEYLRYAFFEPGVSGAIFDVATIRALETAIDALEQGPLTDDEHTYLEDLADVHRGSAELAREYSGGEASPRAAHALSSPRETDGSQ